MSYQPEICFVGVIIWLSSTIFHCNGAARLVVVIIWYKSIFDLVEMTCDGLRRDINTWRARKMLSFANVEMVAIRDYLEKCNDCYR